MKLILSTSNITAPSVQRGAKTKSNAELVDSLRSNFEAHYGALPNGHADGGSRHPSSRPSYKAWTRRKDDTLEIPALTFTEPLQEEEDQYDITLKLFYLPLGPVSKRGAQTRDALDLVLRELNVRSVDLLIVSFPGIYFDEEENCPEKLSTRGPVESEPESMETQVETWRMLEKLCDEGLVKRLGIAEFGHDRLQSFLEKTRIKPSVDQINLRDCCSVPKDLLTLAKSQNVQLLVHNDCSNILPRGSLRELLGPGEGGAGVLAEAPKVGDKRKSVHGEPDDLLTGEVIPAWVLKYTALVKARGVLESRGYFAGAELETQA